MNVDSAAAHPSAYALAGVMGSAMSILCSCLFILFYFEAESRELAANPLPLSPECSDHGCEPPQLTAMHAVLEMRMKIELGAWLTGGPIGIREWVPSSTRPERLTPAPALWPEFRLVP